MSPTLENVSPDDIKGRIICKKCGKDIEYTKGVELFKNCPRCHAPLERNLEKENKDVKKVINYDLTKRLKKYLLFPALFLAGLALAYSIVGFFTELFANHGWWLAFVSLPLIIVSMLLTKFPRLKTTSKKYKVFSWIAFVLNIIAFAAFIVTVIPDVNAKLLEWYRVAA